MASFIFAWSVIISFIWLSSVTVNCQEFSKAATCKEYDGNSQVYTNFPALVSSSFLEKLWEMKLRISSKGQGVLGCIRLRPEDMRLTIRGKSGECDAADDKYTDLAKPSIQFPPFLQLYVSLFNTTMDIRSLSNRSFSYITSFNVSEFITGKVSTDWMLSVSGSNIWPITYNCIGNCPVQSSQGTNWQKMTNKTRSANASIYSSQKEISIQYNINLINCSDDTPKNLTNFTSVSSDFKTKEWNTVNLTMNADELEVSMNSRSLWKIERNVPCQRFSTTVLYIWGKAIWTVDCEPDASYKVRNRTRDSFTDQPVLSSSTWQSIPAEQATVSMDSHMPSTDRDHAAEIHASESDMWHAHSEAKTSLAVLCVIIFFLLIIVGVLCYRNRTHEYSAAVVRELVPTPFSPELLVDQQASTISESPLDFGPSASADPLLSHEPASSTGTPPVVVQKRHSLEYPRTSDKDGKRNGTL